MQVSKVATTNCYMCTLDVAFLELQYPDGPSFPMLIVHSLCRGDTLCVSRASVGNGFIARISIMCNYVAFARARYMVYLYAVFCLCILKVRFHTLRQVTGT